jgi:hypothetical protein
MQSTPLPTPHTIPVLHDWSDADCVRILQAIRAVISAEVCVTD